VAYGERLCFEGAPIVEPPLAQDVTKRTPEIFEGEAIDTTLVVPRLTEYERQLVDEAKTASTEALGKTATEIRVRHDRTLAELISDKTGMPFVSASRSVAGRHRGLLLPHLDLEFDHLGIVSVAEVLGDPDRFVGETLADPLEGVEYGRCKAKVMRGDDGGLFIHSFAHGRSFYRLRHDARSAKAAIAQAPVDGLIDYAMTILATAEMEPDELADFVATVAKATGIGVRAVKAWAEKERREREQAERKLAAASVGDGRIIRNRPQDDEELLPMTKFLDEALASDQREEPPMRDASGNLVEVRVQEPWTLHLLTADGTNAAIEDAETMKAPAEPGLDRLTPTGVKMLVERYVRFDVQKKNSSYFGALPGSFVVALMEYSPSGIPVARAINTAPLVTQSGQVIEGVGLDRNTGIVHRIDPLLRACLPPNPPTEADVREALLYLLDEWLVDVALDLVGKCIAIMLAMTLIERALLEGRSAFFVTAGQRGGGKTTLVIMITLAALGRRAAAAAWSEKSEERKKALFSYLRQSLACVVWDNIPRGAAISCPHIEAALTAAETSDRVLGVSVEYAASLIGTTVDCTELMRAGEVGDEEASAASAALTIMHGIWGDRAFTAMDIVKAMMIELHLEDAEKLKAEAVAEALGELVGKRLERPTARSIGKLFQKKLVGRPAWIGDGQAFAVLERFKGHNANTYRIQVTGSVDDQKHSPHSPHSPNRTPCDGELGNEGNEGNEGKDFPVKEVVASNFKRAKAGWSGRL
jgi:hypothetical protein